MAKQQTRYADFITQWERILVSLLANIANLPHLEAPRAKLQALLEEFRTLVTQQDLHAASKQQISQRLKILLADGKKLATFPPYGYQGALWQPQREAGGVRGSALPPGEAESGGGEAAGAHPAADPAAAGSGDADAEAVGSSR